MRRVLHVFPLLCAGLVFGCQGSDKTPISVASPSSVPNLPQSTLSLTGEVQLGGDVVLADGGFSALALYDVAIDAVNLTGTSRLVETRQAQANDDLFSLSLAKYLKPNSFSIAAVGATATTLDVTWEFEHPFAAPNNPTGLPNASTNRADLGFSGMIMPLVDVSTAVGHTFFTDRIANTALCTNADAYFAPAGLLALTGLTANTFPYQTIVDERGPTGSRVGITNGGSVVGNFDPDGWIRTELGGGIPFDKWTGYGVLHQGQRSRRTLSLNLAELAGAGGVNFKAAVLIKYNDPRQGATGAIRRTHRLPPATADAAIFGYRMPHGALDCQRIIFEGATGPGFQTNQISNETLRFHVEDWDARAPVTTFTADLSLDPSLLTVVAGEAGPPTLDVCIPGVLGGTTTVDTWSAATLLNIDTGIGGGDPGQDTGQPGDALYYEKSVSKGAVGGQSDGFYYGMVRVTDPENSIVPALVTPLDGGTLLALTSNLPMPVTYQAFRVTMTGAAGDPVLSLTTPPNVQSGTSTFITVTGAYDPNGDTINVAIDWDNDTVFEDARTILSPYTLPIVWSRPGNVNYNNPSLTPAVQTIPVRYDDGIALPIAYTPPLTFTLGPNRPPIVVGGPGLGLQQICRPSPATFSVTRTGLTISDPEGDPITYTVAGSPDAGAPISTSGIGAFPFGGPAAGPYTNPSVTEVSFLGWANDALHPGTSGTSMPLRTTPLIGLVSGNIGWVRSWGGIGTDYGKSIGLDSTRSIYTGGQFQSTVDFDPGPGVDARTAASGSTQMFLTKTNPVGKYQQVTTWGAPSAATVNGIAVTSAGEVYMVGTFTGLTDFDPSAGSTTATPIGGKDAFAFKLDASGALVWVATWGGTGDDTAEGVVIDSSNRPNIVGSFRSMVDFDPGPGSATRTAAGGSDGYALRLIATTGALDKLATIGNVTDDSMVALVWENSGNLYVDGRFTGSIDLDPGVPTVTRSATNARAGYILKLNGDYNYVWDAVVDINIVLDGGIDSENNTAVYQAGAFTGTGDFDAGVPVATANAGTSADAFIVRYSTAGAYSWADTIGSVGTDAAAVTAIEVGETLVFAAGRFTGTQDFDPGAGTFNLSVNAGGSAGDFFLWKLHALPGTLDTAVHWGNGQNGQCTDIAFGGCSTFVQLGTGFYVGTLDFDPGVGIVNATSLGGPDAFLLQLRGDLLTF